MMQQNKHLYTIVTGTLEWGWSGTTIEYSAVNIIDEARVNTVVNRGVKTGIFSASAHSPQKRNYSVHCCWQLHLRGVLEGRYNSARLGSIIVRSLVLDRRWLRFKFNLTPHYT